jgi:molecular chaperone DnaK (HSP70)
VTGSVPKSLNFALALEELSAMGLPSSLAEMKAAYNARHPNEPGLDVRGVSTLRLPAALIMRLFDTVLAPIKRHVDGVCRTHSPQYVVLAGGFAESEVLQESVKRALAASHPSVCVVVPVHPGHAVVKGAALYGLSHASFASRIARYTYGIKTCTTYDASNPRHSGCATAVYDGVQNVEDVFNAYVAKGETVPVGKVVTRSFVPATMAQTSVSFQLLKTEVTPTPFLATAPGLTRCGCVEIKVPPCSRPGEKADIEVSFNFGDTEVTVTARHGRTTETYRLDFND